jgi:hypothetical protein
MLRGNKAILNPFWRFKMKLFLSMSLVLVALTSQAQAGTHGPYLDCKLAGYNPGSISSTGSAEVNTIEGILRVTIRNTDLTGQVVAISDALGSKLVYNASNASIDSDLIFVRSVPRSILGKTDIYLAKSVDAKGVKTYSLQGWFQCTSEDPDLCQGMKGRTVLERSVAMECRLIQD